MEASISKWLKDSERNLKINLETFRSKTAAMEKAAASGGGTKMRKKPVLVVAVDDVEEEENVSTVFHVRQSREKEVVRKSRSLERKERSLSSSPSPSKSGSPPLGPPPSSQSKNYVRSNNKRDDRREESVSPSPPSSRKSAKKSRNEEIDWNPEVDDETQNTMDTYYYKEQKKKLRDLEEHRLNLKSMYEGSQLDRKTSQVDKEIYDIRKTLRVK